MDLFASKDPLGPSSKIKKDKLEEEGPLLPTNDKMTKKLQT